jgi:hypothetical protein
MRIICNHTVEGLSTNIFTELYNSFREGYIVVTCNWDIKIRSSNGTILRDRKDFFSNEEYSPCSNKRLLHISCISNDVYFDETGDSKVGKSYTTSCGDYISPIIISKWDNKYRVDLFNHSTIFSEKPKIYIQSDSYNCVTMDDETPIGPLDKNIECKVSYGGLLNSGWVNNNSNGTKTSFVCNIQSLIYYDSVITIYTDSNPKYEVTDINKTITTGTLHIKTKKYTIYIKSDLTLHAVINTTVWLTIKGCFGYTDINGFHALDTIYNMFDICGDKILCHTLNKKVDIYSETDQILLTIDKESSSIYTCSNYFINVGNGKCDIYYKDLKLAYSFNYEKTLHCSNIFRPVFVKEVFYLVHIYGNHERYSITSYSM